MGRRELLEALQREGRETMAAISARCAAEEERLRAEFEERRTALREQNERQCEILCNGLQRMIMSKASREVALIRLRAEHSLSLRLHERASIGVIQMLAEDPAALFRSLVAELPTDSWGRVRVNPEFAPLAAECFPGAGIVPEPFLSGGFIVTSADGSLTVDNTLNTRLERLWSELLPGLTAELRGSPHEE